MFVFLKKKLNRYIIISIMLVFTIPFLSLYFTFRHTLESDYIQNSYKTHKQITQLLNIKISQIESSIDMYIFRSRPDKMFLNENHTTSDSDFKTLHIFSPAIDYVAIYDSNMKLISYDSFSPISDFTDLLKSDSMQQSLLTKEKFWTNKYFSFARQLYWIYTAPIFSNDNFVGYISVMIRNSFFEEFFEDFNNDYCAYNSFYLYSETGKEACINEILLKEKNLNDTIITSAVYENHNQQDYKSIRISAYPLETPDMHLICILRNNFPLKLSNIFLLWLAVAWIILTCLCIIFTSKISNQFINDLRALSKKVKNYTNSKQEEEKNDRNYDCR